MISVILTVVLCFPLDQLFRSHPVLAANWTAYTDMVAASCTQQGPKRATIHISLLSKILSCVRAQRLYLQCGPKDSSQLDLHSKPCGVIQMSGKVSSDPVTKMWQIVIHKALHINLTFLDFHLAISHGECRELKSAQVLSIWSVQQTEEIPVSLCGQRTRFFLIWNSSNAVIEFLSLEGVRDAYFRLHYQACDSGTKATFVQRHKIAFLSKTNTLYTIENQRMAGERGALYTLHLFGSRLKVLELRLLTTTLRFFSADLFEGPGPSEIHRHPHIEKLVVGDWVLLRTFQAYLRITCNAQECQHLRIQYRLQEAVIFGTGFEFGETLKFHMPSPYCSGDAESLVYCVYLFKSKARGTNAAVQAELTAVSFAGPDYVADAPGDHSCLLAGVTIADALRTKVTRKADSVLKGVSSPSKEAVMDMVLPELTTCYKVPFLVRNGQDQVNYKLPMDAFVSTSSEIILVVYAFGGYIDLEKSYIELTLSPTSCVGLILGCYYLPPGVNFVELGSNNIDSVFLTKELEKNSNRCPGSLLRIRIFFNTRDSFNAAITWCSRDLDYTEIRIWSALSAETTASDRCLYIALNSYAIHKPISQCALVEEDVRDNIPRHYRDVSVNRKHSIWCTDATLQVGPNLISVDFPEWDPIRLTGSELADVLTATDPECGVAKITVVQVCNHAVEVARSEPTYRDVEQDLDRGALGKMCSKYSVPLHNQRTFSIYLQQDFVLSVLERALPLNTAAELTLFMLNTEVARLQLLITSILRECTCSACGTFDLVVFYREPENNKLVSLKWELFLSSGLSKSIGVYHLPKREWLVYITGHQLSPDVVNCSLEMKVSTMRNENPSNDFETVTSTGVTPFSFYVLLWTSQRYTWYEAENVCLQGGMHLASISTPEEYQLLTALLAGKSYLNEQKQWTEDIVTPCRLHFVLCVTYIGLQVQNGVLKWSDKGPAGFMTWNQASLTGTILRSIKQEEENGTFREVFQEVINKTSKPQPQYTKHKICAMLVGSPGPSDMEYRTIPCNASIQVSGIVCSKKNRSDLSNEIVYRLAHYKPKQRAVSYKNNINTYFSINNLHTSFLQKPSIKVNDSVGGKWFYYEGLESSFYQRLEELQRRGYQRMWSERVYNCLHATSYFCEALKATNASVENVHEISSSALLVTKKHHLNLQSVYKVNQSLYADRHCQGPYFLVGKDCFDIVQTQPDLTRDADPERLCRGTGSQELILNPSGKYVHRVFQRFKIGREQSLKFYYQSVFLLTSNETKAMSYRESNAHGNNSSLQLVLCHTKPLNTTCPPGYRTLQGECISSTYLCDGRHNYSSSVNEQACDSVCHASFPASRTFCFKECHPDNCTCSSLYYQCPGGGCLHTSKLCDGSNDCVDSGNDESICPDAQGLLLKLNTRAYFQTSDNSKGTLSFKYKNDSQWECLETLPALFPEENRCLYDHDKNGRLMYCRNGLHLRNCRDIDCSRTFKCRHSYCIPVRKVCDGVLDCPYGDDESACPLNNCINMLRCGNVCVHPTEICDGISHCEHGEDELLCDSIPCPEGCICEGYGFQCTANFTRPTWFRSVTSQPSGRDVIVVMKVFVLDMSWCNIAEVPRNAFQSLATLLRLDLSHNQIRSLGKALLYGLWSLYELDVSWNPIKQVSEETFTGLSNFAVLNMRGCGHLVLEKLSVRLLYLPLFDLSHCDSVMPDAECCLGTPLGTLNLTGTQVHSLVGFSANLSRVLSDQIGLCCVRRIEKSCTSFNYMCKSLFPSNGAFVVVYGAVAITTLGILGVMPCKSRSRDTFLIFNLVLCNLANLLSLYTFAEWHIKYGTEISFYEPFISSTVYCQTSAGLLLASKYLFSWFSFILALQRYLAIAKQVIKKARTHLSEYLLVLGGWFGYTALWIGVKFQEKITSARTIKECLYGVPVSNTRRFLLFCDFASIFVMGANMVLHAAIFKVVWQSCFLKVGLRHGKFNATSSLKRIAVTIIVTGFQFIPAMTLLVDRVRETNESISYRLPVFSFLIGILLQSVSPPLLFTIFSRLFASRKRQCSV